MKDSATARIKFEVLKEKQRRLRVGFPQNFGLRIHRSISWIGRAEAEATDPAAAFLFLWIAFNAAYADERDVRGEREAFAWFFGMFRNLDKEGRIYDAVWMRFPGPIRLFLENRFVFGPFWSCQNGISGYEDWEERFNSARRAFHRALTARDTADILSMLFDRLYVLRNQLVHGGATWNSRTNRDQLRDGADILGFLVPVMIDIMMENSSEDWGRPFYPVVES
ncbi:MAG: hypothetical protein EOR52_15015 [Mesorhizobium sp.]|uniref:HEPN domain-containing protein n=1 Tax=Mesorhizobium sp. TaxID=1871066 RepID=UPI000FE9DB26|nr:HEPN domain-containing protein [Mesorhizobium sp.]RWK87963.1 MAG: hypothetical protein EOR52_15015 [Mesorhizobium sp.]